MFALRLWFARKRIARLQRLTDRWIARARRLRERLDRNGHRARDGPE